MSIVLCTGCGYLVDSDNEPECFVQISKYGWIPYCKSCREENENAIAEQGQEYSDRYIAGDR